MDIRTGCQSMLWHSVYKINGEFNNEGKKWPYVIPSVSPVGSTQGSLSIIMSARWDSKVSQAPWSVCYMVKDHMGKQWTRSYRRKTLFL